MSKNKWVKEQFEYLKSLDKTKILALKIYSQSYLFNLLNKFCNQIIDIDDILDYKLEKLVKKYCIKKGILEANRKDNKQYYIYITNIIISLIEDLIDIIENSPSTPELKLKRGTSHYYFSTDSNTLINYGFVSTSFNKDVAERFSGRSCCMFNITLPKNSKGIFLSLLDYTGEDLKYKEHEVLLLPYSSFKILDIKETKWYHLGPDEYEVVYEGNSKYYNQFNIYKRLMLAIYFDKDINQVERILNDNPININKELIKCIYNQHMFTDEIANVIFNKKINIEVDYIVYSINEGVKNKIIMSLISRFREFGDTDKLNDIINSCIKSDNTEIIRHLNLYYRDYMKKLDSSYHLKISNWFSKLFNR